MIFTRIMDKLKHGRQLWPQELVLGMRRSQIADLKQMRAEPGFAAMLDLLDNLVRMKAEGLLLPDYAHVDFARGYIAGVQAAAGSVDLAITTQENNDVRRRERDDARTSEPDTSRERSLYGTPSWSAARSE